MYRPEPPKPPAECICVVPYNRRNNPAFHIGHCPKRKALLEAQHRSLVETGICRG